MQKTELSIATISLARNDDEEKLLRASLKQLAELNIPVYITDGGSSESFLEFLHSIPHFIVMKAKGLWPQAKKSMIEAHKEGPKFIFYTEPDKQEFFTHHLQTMLETIAVNENAGVVLASRSKKSFSGFPFFQQMTETTINNCCKEIIKMETDYCYGPFLFNSQLVPYMQSLDENCGWGWRPFLFAVAHRLGFAIENYEGDFNCPPEQRQDDAKERIYRMKQLAQNINGLVLATAVDLNKT